MISNISRARPSAPLRFPNSYSTSCELPVTGKAQRALQFWPGVFLIVRDQLALPRHAASPPEPSSRAPRERAAEAPLRGTFRGVDVSHAATAIRRPGAPSGAAAWGSLGGV